MSAGDAPLHPRRIEETLDWLRRERPAVLQGEHYETIVSVLKLVRKGQRATGLSAEIVDMGSAATNFFKALRQIK